MDLSVLIRIVVTCLGTASLPLLQAGEPEVAGGGDFPWRADYSEAVEESATRGRPLLVMLTAEWCGWCKVLERETLSDPRVQEALKPFVPVKVYEDKELNRTLGYAGYPTLVFVGPDGSPVHRVVGHRKVGPFLKEVLTACEALDLNVPESLQELAGTSYEPDVELLMSLEAAGDVEGLLEELAPIEDDPLNGTHFLVAKLLVPPSLELPVDIFWQWGYEPVPKSGVKLLAADRPTIPFHITVKGFEQIAHTNLFGESQLASKTFQLQPVAPEQGASLRGVVRLPNGAPDPNAIVRLYDWDAVRTDEQGRFAFEGVSPGSFTVAAERPGAVVAENLALKPGETHRLELTTQPARTAHVRWVYQAEEGEEGFVEGIPIEGEAYLSEKTSRFSLRRGHPLGNWGSDFMMDEKDGRLVFWLFDSSGGTHGLAASTLPFEQLEEADLGAEYEFLRGTEVKAGDTYAVKCLQGEHYAKMQILAVDPPWRPSGP